MCTGKPRPNPLRDSSVESVLQKLSFRWAHTYQNSQPYVVTSILVLHKEEFGMHNEIQGK